MESEMTGVYGDIGLSYRFPSPREGIVINPEQRVSRGYKRGNQGDGCARHQMAILYMSSAVDSYHRENRQVSESLPE